MSLTVGTCADDVLTGSDGNDLMVGLWGEDDMYGGAGNDLMFGGSGNDTMDGGSGHDILFGGRGSDLIQGGADCDWLFGGSGADVIYGDSMLASGPVDPDFNYVVNGSFEDTTGLRQTDFGFVTDPEDGFAGSVAGWTNNNGSVIEVVETGVVDQPAAEGDYWLDSGSQGAQIIDISQQIEGLTDGSSYKLSFQAGQWDVPSPAPDETLNVYWNGELLDNVRPETIDAYETFEFDIIAGSGDGTNTLRFEGVTDGTRDFQGVVIDDVQITAVAPEEDGGQDVISGGRGDDEIFGGAESDIIKGGKGNDLLNGGEGADYFLFGKYDGTDTITDFELGIDMVAIYAKSSWYYSSGDLDYGDLSITQQGDDAEVSFAYTTVIFEGTQASDLTEDDFLFL